MQDELATEHPELNIQFLGVNEVGQEFGNSSITENRDLPWLQDVDSDSNGNSDVWVDKWNVTFRDVVILDGQNREVDRYNVTVHDLSVPSNYNTLKQLLIDTASGEATVSPWQNTANPLDVDGDTLVTPVGDVLTCIDELNLRTVIDQDGRLPVPDDQVGPPPFYDVNGDGFLSPVQDVLAIIEFLNQPQGEGEAASTAIAVMQNPIAPADLVSTFDTLSADVGQTDGSTAGDPLSIDPTNNVLADVRAADAVHSRLSNTSRADESDDSDHALIADDLLDQLAADWLISNDLP